MYDYIKAHDFCSNHKAALLRDAKCGCFYCLNIFNPKEIEVWLNETGGTALCPYCCVDAIIGESSGYPVTVEFLKKMHDYWF